MKWRRVVLWIAGIAILMALLAATTLWLLMSPAVKIRGWQELDLQRLAAVRQTVTLLDSDGKTLSEGVGADNRMYVSIDRIPQHTIDAFVSVEDKRFFKHRGVDYIRMLGAVRNNLFSRSRKEGASTITQQLIKNTHLSNKKTFTRKLQEIRIAKQLEKVYSKKEILQSYLNVIYFGNNVYGIGRAAQTYFHKDVSALEPAESALLAGMINNPSRYNPYTHAEKAKARRNLVLDRMAVNKKIDAASAEAAKETPLGVRAIETDRYRTIAENAVKEAAQILDCLPEDIYSHNYTIYTTASTESFNIINRTMRDIAQKSSTNMRIFVRENLSGKVVYDWANVGTSSLTRQPGSAIKPFIAYAPALEKKIVYPASVLCDEKKDFNGYTPGNFNEKYYGDVTVSDSLKYSLNIPAVTLTDMCGVSYAKSVASRFGIRFTDKDNGLAVALGGFHKGVTLPCLADAYATLANGGIFRKSSYVLAIYDGDICLYRNASDDGTRAVREDTAFLLTDMLRSCAKDGTAKKLCIFDNIAAKTGTVERGEYNSDAYCIAYSPQYTVAVWYGCDTGTQKIYGGKEPTQAAKRIFEILDDTKQFAVPDSVIKRDIDVKKLYEERAVYLAAPTLPQRYCRSVYFSKYHMPQKYSYGELPLYDDFLADLDNFEIFERLVQ